MQKSHVVFSLAIASLAACVVTVSLAIPVRADPPVQAAAEMQPETEVAEPAPSAPPTAEPVLDKEVTERHEKLSAYTLDVMNGWTHAVPSVPVADYESIASDIATAVMEDNRPIADQAHDAVLLAGLAYWEGARYAAYVDELLCNDPSWRKSPEGQRMMLGWGDCDHGIARSMWQIHSIVDKSSHLYEACNVDVVSGSRHGAARCALLIARGSLTSTGDLSGYTGEWAFSHPKADVRLRFILDASRKRPFRAP